MHPCCENLHTRDPGTGHHVAQRKEEDCFSGIIIGGRSFVPACGCTTMEHVSEDDVNESIAQP